MTLRLKLWSVHGACLLAGAAALALSAAPAAAALQDTRSRMPAGEGGEGGEGGEAGGAAPSRYRLLLAPERDPQYDGTALARAYVANVHRAYVESAGAARRMQQAIEHFLAQPGAARLAQARRAWTEARRPYLATEAYRFYDGPIDGPAAGTRPAGPESRLNAWPLNEAVIDHVEGAPRAGLVHAFDVPLTRTTILARDQVSDEADVTTGWHAIEFLLWGQDLDAQGAGARPASDFDPGDAAAERRRRYLELLAALLVEDLDALAQQWDAQREASYAREFLALPPHEAVGRMLTGAALLAGHELASERLAVALDSGAQEDEQSCFSDTTWQDFAWGLAGIKRVYYGRGEEASIAAALSRLDPPLALRLEHRFAVAERALAALPQPFDTMLSSPPGSPGRSAGEAAVLALQQLAAALRDAGRALGVLVLVPGV